MSHIALREGEDILVVTAGFWDTPKRVRHKMPMQWAKAGCRVLWIEQSPFPPTELRPEGRLKKSITGELREVAPRLFVGAMPPAIPKMHRGGRLGEWLKRCHAPLYYRRIETYMETLQLAPTMVVLVQQAARHDLFDRFPDCLKIYYHHDVYGYGHATPAQERLLDACCRKADMVWCTALEHRDALQRLNPSTHYIPHAVDVPWFEANRDRRPTEYDEIPEPRAVYTGVFQEKIDLPLLIDTAKRRPAWQFVFVGPVDDRYLDRELVGRLARMENVHMLGQKDVDELPGYMTGATVLMLPYLPTENMKSTGLSLKFYEYLITGKPIVIAPFTEMQVSDSLYYMANGSEAWAELLDELENGDGDDRASLRVAEALKNSYDARLETQRQLLRRRGE